MYDLDGVLGGAITQFVEKNVRSLLAWDILVFFHRNPEAVLDVAGLGVCSWVDDGFGGSCIKNADAWSPVSPAIAGKPGTRRASCRRTRASRT